MGAGPQFINRRRETHLMTMERQPTEQEQAFLKLRKWREPRHPYVVFKKPFREILSSGNEASASEEDRERGAFLYEDVVTYDVRGTLRQTVKLDKLMTNKFMQVITWGNFPARHDKGNTILSAGADMGPYEELNLFLQRKAGMAAEADERVSALERKLQEKTREVEELKAAEAAKQGGKHGK